MTEIQIGALILIIPLLVSAIVDAKYFIIPNSLNILILISGLIFNITTNNLSIKNSMLGIILGSFMAYGISFSFYRLKGYVGLGLGDVKLLAAGGAWIGWIGLAPTLFLSSTTALIYVGIRYLIDGKFEATTRIPFAPFLGGAIFVIWLLQTLRFSLWGAT